MGFAGFQITFRQNPTPTLLRCHKHQSDTSAPNGHSNNAYFVVHIFLQSSAFFKKAFSTVRQSSARLTFLARAPAPNQAALEKKALDFSLRSQGDKHLAWSRARTPNCRHRYKLAYQTTPC
jgi:hypothetical protein